MALGRCLARLVFFHKYAGKAFEDKRPLQRYVDEAKRLLTVLNQRLEQRTWLMGDEYSIADITIFPWVHCLLEHYEAQDLVGFGDFSNVARAHAAFMQRPAVIRGMEIPAGHV